MVHLVCLFMKTHLVMLLQDNILDLLCCTFLSKLSGCVRMRNITEFCQHLLSFGRYRYISKTQILVSARPIYRSISGGKYSIALKKIGKFWVVVVDIVSRVGFRSFWLRLLGPGHQPLDVIF